MTRAAPSNISVHVPFAIRKHGGRKRMVSPDGASEDARPRIDNTLVKALARAFRWRRLLDDGHYATLADLAEAERINPSYLSRVLRLTLLAPAIVEAAMQGRLAGEATLKVALEPFPACWVEQRTHFGL